MRVNLETAPDDALDRIRRDPAAHWAQRTVAGLLYRARQHRKAGRPAAAACCEDKAGMYFDALPETLRW